MKFQFVKEENKYLAKIKVIGIGGAGGNAINNMISSQFQGVDFVVANTDSQDLGRSLCPNMLQLGPSSTQGLGTGGNPEIGSQSAEESINEIKEAVSEADMIFLTAGMGGGTGTGASPVIAHQCKENAKTGADNDKGALTVAVVTKPFSFEGKKRMERANDGIEKLRKEVDSLIIVPNDRLRTLEDKGASFKELLSRADDVLFKAVKGVSDLIMTNGFINLDFADVKNVMKMKGTAIMGIGRESGENRGIKAAETAINSPLLEDISIEGAKGLLINITGPTDMTMDEIDEACNFIKDQVNDEVDTYWGVVLDDDMDDEIQITVVATGIGNDEQSDDLEKAKVVRIRDITPEEASSDWSIRFDGKNLAVDERDRPTFERNRDKLINETPNDKSRSNEVYKNKKGFFGKFKDSRDIPTFLRVKAD